MKLKASDVIGLKIISLDKGEEVGEVSDIIYDPLNQNLKAFLIDKGGWFSEARIVPFDLVQKIGMDALTVNSSLDIKKASEMPDPVWGISEKNSKIRRMSVVTEDGNNVGRVSDVLFDNQTGELIEYEISKGPIEDLKSGRKKISKANVIRVGQDNIIVKSENGRNS